MRLRRTNLLLKSHWSKDVRINFLNTRMWLIKSKKLFVLAVSVSITFVIIFWKIDYEQRIANVEDVDRFVQVLSLFNLSATYCEDLSRDWKNLHLSKTYHEKLTQFESKRQEAYEGQTDGEGHSGQVPEEYLVLHLLAGVSGDVTVCETGFNFGHSAFNVLTANDKLRVFSFDLGNHLYARKMAVNLAEMFGSSRINVEFGDSQTSIPKFKSKKLLPLCDIIFIDGGHTFDVAKADITNLATHASKHNIIIMDDHPTDWSNDFGKAWDMHLQSKAVQGDSEKECLQNGSKDGKDFGIIEYFRCARRQKVDNLSRGFVVGRAVFNECR